jgi:hypothetical protein
MWTVIGVIVGIAAMVGGAIWYIRRSESNDIELEAAKIKADLEAARRHKEEEAAAKEAARRKEEFNAKADAVRDAAGAAELLNESARRSTD